MKLGNKGVTIVEAVVAMTLIVIITYVATQISVSALATSNNAEIEFKAVNTTSDLVTLYRTTNNKEEFIETIEAYLEVDCVESNNYDFTFESDRLVYEITYYSFLLQINVHKTNKTDSIYKYSYRNGTY